MTDARFPERWLNDRRILRLTDAEFRSFVTSLAWAVSNRTDGKLDLEDLTLVPGFRHETIPAFVQADLWAVEGKAWQIVDFATTQSTAAQLNALDEKRLKDRDRQARHRTAVASEPDPHPPTAKRDSSRDVTRDITRDITRDVAGVTKARTGKARTGFEVSISTSSEDDADAAWTTGASPPPGRLCPECDKPIEAGMVRHRACFNSSMTERKAG